MGIDVKEIQVSVKRFLGLFGKSCSTFVKKYPILSGVFLFFFLLYMFIPSLFIFIIFSVPILVFIFISFRQIFKIHNENLKIAKGEKRDHGNYSQKQPNDVVEAKDVVVGSKRDRSSACIQRLPGGRRNDNEKDKHVFAKEGMEEEKDTVSSTTLNEKDSIDKAALVDDNPIEIREVKVDSVTDYAETSSTSSQWLNPPGRDERRKAKSNGHGSEAVSVSSDDGEDEEEARRERNKAVEWTEDDQKNLMDLGNSEMERNKRLESLIAKRKARKMLSMQVRRTLMNLGNNDPCSQIPRVLVPRENPYAFNNSSPSQVSPTPGSAPSVLLPMHNPYDLPYDPQEEKPNLLGDSFDEDFRDPAQQKEMVFCRHESFSLGTFFPGPCEFDQSRREPFFSHSFYSGQKTPEIPEYSALRNQSGNEGSKKRIQTGTFEEGQPSEREFNLLNIDREEDGNKVQKDPNVARSSSSLTLKSIVVDGERDSQPEEVLYDRSPSSTDKERPNNSLFYIDKREDYPSRHSIASDLQVELSEIGSPVLTEDETISPLDGDSKTYDKDVNVNEEPWVAPENLSGVEENESKSKEVHEVSEQDIVEVGCSRIKQDSDDSVNESNLPADVLVQQEKVHASPSSPMDDGEVHYGDQPSSSSQASVALSHENMAALPTCEYAPQSTDISEEQPSYSAEKSTDESVKYDTDDLVSFTRNEAEILEFIQNTYGEVPTLVGDTIGDMSKSSPAIDEVTGHQENEHPQSTQHSEEDVLTRIEDNNNGEESNLTRIVSDQYGGREEIGSSDVGSSEASQNYNNPAASVQPDVLAERGPTCSSSSSSLSSIAEDKEPSISSATSTRESNIDRNMNVEIFHDMGNFSTVEERVIDEPEPEPTNDSPPSPMLQESVNGQVPTALSASSSPMTEENRLQSLDTLCIQDQSEGMGDNQDVLESNEPRDKSDDRESFEDLEGQYLKIDESRNTEDATNLTEGNGDLVPAQEPEEETVGVETSEAGTSTSGLNGRDSELNQGFLNEQAPRAELTEVVVEQVPIASSSSSSPKSVLQKKFSVASFEQMVSVGIQRSEIDTEEISSPNELPPENSTSTSPQTVLHSVDESTSPPSNAAESYNLEEVSEYQGNLVEGENIISNQNSASSNEDEVKPRSQTIERAEGEPTHETSTDSQPSNVATDEGPGGEVQEMTSGAEGGSKQETSRDLRPSAINSDGGPEGEPEHETSRDSLPSVVAGDGDRSPGDEVQEFSNGAEGEPKHETSRDSQPPIIANDGGPEGDVQDLSIGAEGGPEHETLRDSQPPNIASGGPGGEIHELSSGAETESEPKHETSIDPRPSNTASDRGEAQEFSSGAEEEPKHETSTNSRPSNIVSEGGPEGEVQDLSNGAEGEPKHPQPSIIASDGGEVQEFSSGTEEGRSKLVEDNEK